ncbi:MAG TPA: hypothetical protein VHZ24_19125 [Pirellulales bacterium]|nr:hypothetical protein [Pirellulales bacterium]
MRVANPDGLSHALCDAFTYQQPSSSSSSTSSSSASSSSASSSSASSSSSSRSSSSGFSPTDIPGLEFWGSAGYGAFQDTAGSVPAVNNGDPVGRWNDRSGHASRYLAAPADANRAARATNSINGLPTVNFNGAGQILELTDGLFTADYLTPATLFAVLRVGDTAASYGRFFAKITAGGDYEIGLQRQAGGNGCVGAVSGCSGVAWQAAKPTASSG